MHVDIGSSLFFVGNVSAYQPMVHYDYRPPALALPGVDVGAADLLNLAFADGSIASLSCMHVVEHVGLGRYGDTLDPAGDVKACAELSRVLAPGGQLLFVTPVGQASVHFKRAPDLCLRAGDGAVSGPEAGRIRAHHRQA